MFRCWTGETRLLGGMLPLCHVVRLPHGRLMARPAVARPASVAAPGSNAAAIRPATASGALEASSVAVVVVPVAAVATMTTTMTTDAVTPTTRMEVTATAPTSIAWIEPRIKTWVKTSSSAVITETPSVARSLRCHHFALTYDLDERAPW